MEKKQLEKFLKEHGTRLIIGAYGEEADCTGLVEEIIDDSVKGRYTKLIGCSYKFKGFPEERIINQISFSKKLITVSLLYLNKWWIRLIVFILALLPSRWATAYEFLKYFSNITYNSIRFVLFPKNLYSPAMKEIDRVLVGIIDDSVAKEKKETFGLIKDNICFIVEMDAAYRFRVQDILPEVSLENLKKNAFREIRRVLKVFLLRDKAITAKIKAVFYLSYFLKFSKQAREIVIRFFTDLDINKIKLDEADRYFCLCRSSYDFWGVSFEERRKQWDIMNKAKGHEIPKVYIKQKVEN